MSDIPAQAFIAIGAVLAALIAGFFSFLNLIVSKEQKVSEFRQAWIDSFRTEISELIAALFHIEYYLRSHSFDAATGEPAKLQAVSGALRESHETYSRSVTSILLRVNPTEKNAVHAKLNSEFLVTFGSLRTAFNGGNYTEACKLSGELRERAAPILKIEWERVKSGERIFRISKLVAVVILAAGLLGVGVLAVIWQIPSNSSTQQHGDNAVVNRSLKSQSGPAGTPHGGAL